MDRLVTCEYCNRDWDGYAQCPCLLTMYSPSESFSFDSDNENICYIDASTQTKRYRWGPTKLEIAQKAVDNYMKYRPFKIGSHGIFSSI